MPASKHKNNNLNTFEIKDISIDSNYKVYGFRSATGADFCVKRIADGAKSISLYIAVYDGGKLQGFTTENIECRQNEPVTFNNTFPVGGTSSKTMLWESYSMAPLIIAL